MQMKKKEKKKEKEKLNTVRFQHADVHNTMETIIPV